MRLAAALVHTFTALGAVCALLAMLAVAGQAWELCFLWLGIALIIDGIDGYFARLVGVKKELPRFSGETLDLVVDYVTYVFVPALALLMSGILPGAVGVALAGAIVLSSLFHFADTGSKSEDLAFVGFPAIWNIVAFYLFAFDAGPEAAAVVVVVCVVLTFVPIKCVHPLRVVHLRWVTVAVTVIWSIAAVAVVVAGFQAPNVAAKAALALAAIYFVGLTLAWLRPKRGDAS